MHDFLGRQLFAQEFFTGLKGRPFFMRGGGGRVSCENKWLSRGGGGGTRQTDRHVCLESYTINDISTTIWDHPKQIRKRGVT